VEAVRDAFRDETLPRFSSREATRQVPPNSDASVGQWMFVSTTVVSARIVVVAMTSCFTACCPNRTTKRGRESFVAQGQALNIKFGGLAGGAKGK
jgi:hypothetical protein